MPADHVTVLLVRFSPLPLLSAFLRVPPRSPRSTLLLRNLRVLRVQPLLPLRALDDAHPGGSAICVLFVFPRSPSIP